MSRADLYKQRLQSRINIVNECWEFTGARDSKGYGRFWYKSEVIMAHRASYDLYVGTIPQGKMILHKCDNPCCVNPDHLFPGTARDNTTDMMNKGRYKPMVGEHCPTARFTREEVITVRKALQEGAKRRDLANQYNVSLGAIDGIKHGRTWGDVS